MDNERQSNITPGVNFIQEDPRYVWYIWEKLPIEVRTLLSKAPVNYSVTQIYESYNKARKFKVPKEVFCKMLCDGWKKQYPGWNEENK